MNNSRRTYYTEMIKENSHDQKSLFNVTSATSTDYTLKATATGHTCISPPCFTLV